MSRPRPRPRLVLTELREYRSAKGSTYFAGYLGKARVVMLRDDRAEITGKEVARWNLLVEEPEPREGRQDRTRGGQDGREARRSDDGPPDQRRGRPGARQGRSGTMPEAERRERSAAERRASQSLRDRGIDPEAPMSSDPLPF